MDGDLGRHPTLTSDLDAYEHIHMGTYIQTCTLRSRRGRGREDAKQAWTVFFPSSHSTPNLWLLPGWYLCLRHHSRRTNTGLLNPSPGWQDVFFPICCLLYNAGLIISNNTVLGEFACCANSALCKCIFCSVFLCTQVTGARQPNPRAASSP